MVSPAPILETERLILRVPEPADFEAWAAWAADEETMRYIGGAQPRSTAWRSICSVLGAWTIQGFSMFSVVEKATGRWIGRMGPWQPADWPGTEIGWALHPDTWGRGYATEGAVACMDYAVDGLGWTDIIHTIDPANAASQAVARKLGSTNRGAVQMPPPFAQTRFDGWGQTADQWRARRR